jgi:UDP-2,3-diacylglucosamine hydrolase
MMPNGHSDSAGSLGLIAGQGQLPILVARGMKAAGARVCCVGLSGHFDRSLPEHCDSFATAGIARLGRWIRLLKREGITQAVMVGRIDKARMHDPWRFLKHMAGVIPDYRALRLWYRHLRHDRRTPVILAALADELARSGITLIDSTAYIPDHLAAAAPEGMGRVKPTPQQQADIAFGWPLLSQIVELDVSQAIAVRDRDVIAVEAVEGTDALIERAGQYCKAKGWTLLKTAKRDHDRRADVPVIGVATIERLAKCGAGCVALGAGRVILIDKPAVIAAADRLKIAVVGIE